MGLKNLKKNKKVLVERVISKLTKKGKKSVVFSNFSKSISHVSKKLSITSNSIILELLLQSMLVIGVKMLKAKKSSFAVPFGIKTINVYSTFLKQIHKEISFANNKKSLYSNMFGLLIKTITHKQGPILKNYIYVKDLAKRNRSRTHYRW